MKKLHLCAISISLLYLPQSYADITFNGFASVRASQANSDGNTSPFSNFEEGEISFKGESLFALQARADLGDGLSATVQLFAEGSNDFDVDARWAYLSYELNDQHQLNIGRVANPLFHQSEYEKVGYTHNFARLPTAVYIGFDFSVIEGISLDSNFEVGDNTLTTKLLYGSWDGDVTLVAADGPVPMGLKDIYSLNLTYSGEWWKVFGGGIITEMKAAVIDQYYILGASAPGIGAAIATGATQTDIKTFQDAIIWDKKDGIYLYAGFGIDYNDWLVDFEYTDYGVDNSIDSYNKTWFVALGKRFDDFVITIHTEEFEQERNDDFLNGVSHPALIGTGKAVHEALSFREFDGNGITLRYDFHPNAAFKLDYFSGKDTRPDVGDYTIFSAGVDIVF